MGKIQRIPSKVPAPRVPAEVPSHIFARIVKTARRLPRLYDTGSFAASEFGKNIPVFFQELQKLDVAINVTTDTPHILKEFFCFLDGWNFRTKCFHFSPAICLKCSDKVFSQWKSATRSICVILIPVFFFSRINLS